jgi:hypothetical protein
MRLRARSRGKLRVLYSKLLRLIGIIVGRKLNARLLAVHEIVRHICRDRTLQLNEDTRNQCGIRVWWRIGMRETNAMLITGSEDTRHGSGNPTRRSNGPGLCHRVQIWLPSLLTWPTSLISPLPTSYVICDRSFVLHPPPSAVKRNGMLVYLPDVMRMLLQHGVIVRRSRIR